MTTKTDEVVYVGRLDIVRCWCGIRVGVPEELRNHQLREYDRGRDFSIWGPLGHQFIPAGKSRAAKLEERLQSTQRESEFWRERNAAAQRSLAATKGHLTRMRNRIANGVCPVPGCRRSGFTNVMRHVASKHPEWHHDHAHEVTP